MKFPIVSLSLVITLIFANGVNAFAQTPPPAPTATATPVPTPTPYPTPCPTALDAQTINTWRTSVSAAYDTLGDSGLGSWINSCFPAPAQIPACLSRIDNYAHRYDGRYFNDADYTTDAHRRLPSELLVSGADNFQYVLRGDIEERAKALGWPVARYKSRQAGGFDSGTPSLLMIEVPGAMLNPPVTFDRFINIALIQDDVEDGTNPTPQKRFPDPQTLATSNLNYPRITTMVTVEHANRQQPKARVYFQMFSRSGNVYSPSGPSNPSSCVSCHPSGLRAIAPLGYGVRAGEKQLDPDNWFQVKRINADMIAGQRGGVTYGGQTDANGKFVPVLDTGSFGPLVGPSEPLSEGTRTREFIVGADGNSGCQKYRTTISTTDIFGRAPGRQNVYTFTSSPPVDWQKVSDAMDCEMCHNNQRQGVLNTLTSFSQIDFKILTDQSMPQGFHKNPLDQGRDPSAPVIDLLNANERIALANCLMAEWNKESSKYKEWFESAPQCTEAAR